MLDLGAWATEAYAVPDPADPELPLEMGNHEPSGGVS